jgi:hypothetical protein
MALKILGQIKVGVGATSTIYQAGAGKAAVGNLIVCNTNAANSDDCIIYLIPSGGSPTAETTIFKQTIPAGESFVVIAGLSLAEAESLRAYATNGYLTFTFTGDES